MKIYYLSILLVLSTYLNAQEMTTDRPDQTESAKAVSVGQLQVETGMLYERSKLNSEQSMERLVHPTSLFRIGLVRNLELRIVSELSSVKLIEQGQGAEDLSSTGAENLQLGFKYQFVPSDKKLVIGLLMHAIVPSGSNEFNDKLYGLSSRINLDYTLSENKGLGLNLGYVNDELDLNDQKEKKGGKGDFIYTLSYGVGMGQNFGLYAEVFGDYINGKYWDNKMDVGMTFLLRENIQFDYSFGWGLDQIFNYHSLGLSVRIPE